MTYRVEITAGSLSELGGKLLALASQFQVTAAEPVMPEVRETAPAKPKAAKAKKEEVGNAPSTEAPKSAPAAEATESQPTTPEPSTTDAPALSASEPASLDFDKDIAPLVLRVVSEKGRDVAIEILSQFGVTRASEVEEARWGELHNVLTDAL